jgi:hypothetical protein
MTSKMVSDRNQKVLLELASQPGNGELCAPCSKPTWLSDRTQMYALTASLVCLGGRRIASAYSYGKRHDFHTITLKLNGSQCPVRIYPSQDWHTSIESVRLNSPLS